jgi:LemA protein
MKHLPTASGPVSSLAFRKPTEGRRLGRRHLGHVHTGRRLDERGRRGAISAGCGVLIGLGVVLVLVGLFLVSAYNGLVASQEGVEGAWAQVQNQYNRRYDQIPQLVETVKGAADFEQETLTQVTEARARVGQAALPENLPTDQAQLDAYIRAQQGLGATLGRLFAVAENYPQLKATQGFLSLQDQLEGTENRIAVARQDYVEAVREFNTRVRTFPRNLIAGTFGFDELPQFSVDDSMSEAPTIDFGDE